MQLEVRVEREARSDKAGVGKAGVGKAGAGKAGAGKAGVGRWQVAGGRCKVRYGAAKFPMGLPSLGVVNIIKFFFADLLHPRPPIL